ncbi:MAG: hypothetical protein M3Q81_05540 [bacterium]|nr:hypothetical protein [bacterium]
MHYQMKNFLFTVVAIGLITAGLAYFSVSGSSSVQAAANNPVIWKTNYAKLAASNFYIRIRDQYYYAPQMMRISSDPGTQRTTLELTWQENTVEMRMNMYFQRQANNTWELSELRTFNALPSGDWIYYSVTDTAGNRVISTLGQPSVTSEHRFMANGGVDAELYCGECTIDAFMPPSIEYSSQGYGLEVMNGLSGSETITVSTDPMTGYGVNVLLRNSKGEVVTDQRGMIYDWKAWNNTIAQVVAGNIEYSEGGCAYGIKAPCPMMNGQIGGLTPGVTKIQVSVSKDGFIIAASEFDVKVVGESTNSIPAPTPSITPQPSTSPTPQPNLLPVDDGSLSEEQLRQELETLKNTVGEIQLDVAQQQKDLSLLQQLVVSLNNFFNRIFGRR